jgi:Zn-dependent protease with chaperone function
MAYPEHTFHSGTRRRLPGLSPHAFEHPLDRTALTTLQAVPGLDWVVRKFITAIGERRLRLLFLASSVRVSDKQFARLKTIYDEACDVLDIPPGERPELYVSQNFQANAAALGVDKPFIVVTSSLLDLLDQDEQRCVLGHELGHIMCGHALYTTVLMLLVNLWYVFLGIPGGVIAMLGIRLALLEWSRKAELSADRAGLLVSQNPDVSYHVDMKLAGGKHAAEMSAEEFINQAEEYRSAGDLLDGVLKLALLVGQTHPFPVLRVAELRRFIDSGDYEKIINGEYMRRGDEPNSSWFESVRATAADYKESLDASADPLFSTLRDLGGGAAATGAEIFEFFKRFGKSDK